MLSDELEPDSDADADDDDDDDEESWYEARAVSDDVGGRSHCAANASRVTLTASDACKQFRAIRFRQTVKNNRISSTHRCGRGARIVDRRFQLRDARRYRGETIGDRGVGKTANAKSKPRCGELSACINST